MKGEWIFHILARSSITAFSDRMCHETLPPCPSAVEAKAALENHKCDEIPFALQYITVSTSLAKSKSFCLYTTPFLFPVHDRDACKHLGPHLCYWDFICSEKMTPTHELPLPTSLSPKMLIYGGAGFILWLRLAGGDCRAGYVNDFWGDAEASEAAWQIS